MNDPLKPKLSLLIKLGSMAVHAEEMMSPDGRGIDKRLVEELLQDSEVKEWMKAIDKLAFLPVKRIK